MGGFIIIFSEALGPFFALFHRSHWGPAIQSAELAIWALSHALGLVLTVDPKKLDLDHPLCCDLNMAIIESRDSRGCDCHHPADPERPCPVAEKVT